jgi:hypothetical protein
MKFFEISAKSIFSEYWKTGLYREIENCCRNANETGPGIVITVTPSARRPVTAKVDVVPLTGPEPT